MFIRNGIGALALAAALVFTPTAAAVSTASTPQPAHPQDETPSQAEQDVFNRGRALFAKGQFEQAANVFSAFLKSHPNSFIADLMLLWLGRSYIEMGKFSEADEVSQRLHTMKDTPFVDIFESELTAAKAEAASRPSAPAASPTPRAQATPVAVARATPTPTPARPARTAPTPRPTPTEIARGNANSNTPSLTIRGGGEAERPRTTGRRRGGSPPAPVNSNANTNRPTPAVSTPSAPAAGMERLETNVAAERNRPARPVSTPAPTPARPIETPTPVISTPPPVGAGDAQGGFSITVRQVPDLQLSLQRAALAAQPGQAIQLPLVITNAGNKEDQFRIETDLPAEYQPTFSQSGNDTGLPIFVTPSMQRGSSIEVMLNARVPDNAPDNQQQRFLVRAASQADATVTRVSDASLTVVAAALAASSNALQEGVQPGETFTQRISVRNQGSAAARSTRADFVFNPDFELVNATPAPIAYDRLSRTAIWALGDLDSRDNREITVTLRAVPEALAGTSKPVGRGTMRTQSLFIPSNFDGPTISVGRVSAARVDAVSKGLTATPGDTMYIPFIVRNPSNYPESFELRIVAPGAPQANVYADLNGDGRFQDGEPAVTQTSALDPRGGQYPVLLRVDIPRTTADRTQFAYNLVTRALNSTGRTASEDSTVLTVATPRVRVRAELPNSEVKPGDTLFYRLVLVNDGGGLAKSLSVTEYLPDALEFISSSPELSMQDMPGGGRGFVWRVAELAPGDTQVLQVTVRLRQNLAAEAVITPRHTLTYQDSNQNPYRGQ
ncbi:MAG TPA: tetratricopeptide repeat protein [Pyrinomonadaceae bacterium]|nr:tetratricopeptide repeat protein [Pyrinomonadaceae bacterium]